jgi:transcriptional regulator with XRE-family HTH domain
MAKGKRATWEEERQIARRAFVEELYRIMEENSISQRELAASMEWTSHTYINRWRNLVAEPRPDELFELEEYLKVPGGFLSIHLGYLPPATRGLVPTGPAVEAAIKNDGELDAKAKRALISAYRELSR